VLTKTANAVIHLAGENRPPSASAFQTVNVGLTQRLCDSLIQQGNQAPLMLASSVQASLENPYGQSKLAAEHVAKALAVENGNQIAIFRLPGVFGKWCRPNYNSVVATFCYNIARDLSIQIHDPEKEILLVYIDDVVDAIISWLDNPGAGIQRPQVRPEYKIKLGELSAQIEAFKSYSKSLMTGTVGVGLVRALYSTYVSYLPTHKFVYGLPKYGDDRGVFVEVLKTQESGQFSFFTAYPGVTRGGHYHHSKTEKFLVIKGCARFRFRHVLTDEVYEVLTNGDEPQVVETVPGWTHDVTNIGDGEMVVMLWANELFDHARPDTIACKI
jgi:UDP-2-acetamido-2,6-beta-L-arabino-hexul-4-ose reductase